MRKPNVSAFLTSPPIKAKACGSSPSVELRSISGTCDYIGQDYDIGEGDDFTEDDEDYDFSPSVCLRSKQPLKLQHLRPDDRPLPDCYAPTIKQNKISDRLKRAEFFPTQRKIQTVGITTLLARGWTRKLVDQYLGEPYALRVNLHYSSGPKRRLWLVDKVLELETTVPEIQKKLIVNAGLLTGD